jgi:hypothetical protein
MTIIRLDVSHLVLLGMLAAALHWLVARAEITRPLWSRIKGRAGHLLACAGCSGFWMGLGLGFLGIRPVLTGAVWLDIPFAGLLALFLTPVFEGALLWGLDASAIQAPERDD